jgi:hypothetical protein
MARNIIEAEWLDAIERDYGVRLSPRQMYADARGRVYAGSEYVARLGKSVHPDDASDWTPSIGHMPRGANRMDVAERVS